MHVSKWPATLPSDSGFRERYICRKYTAPNLKRAIKVSRIVVVNFFITCKILKGLIKVVRAKFKMFLNLNVLFVLSYIFIIF